MRTAPALRAFAQDAAQAYADGARRAVQWLHGAALLACYHLLNALLSHRRPVYFALVLLVSTLRGHHVSAAWWAYLLIDAIVSSAEYVRGSRA